ncbi:VIT1/CCC1 transporter family protein [Rhabdochlamydiaceae symbiont of Dictyostelium giganteum]|uniref:VIT1/CCC1 transporter family protein n=1 Tax=Rhabdochlamydiaceae symbiont of Dictyostelium giganteum TaxID=3342349 RepID=UPI00384FD9A1
MTPSHFKDKSILEHLKEARAKGYVASLETHGLEMPGPYAAGFDAARETALLGGAIFLLIPALSLGILSKIFLSFLIWKAGRSALLGWARLERLHRLMKEERSEILKNRKEEESELKALYAAKGLSGELLDDVITVLSSDDNRLLEIMLEEELGLSLEIHPHPLEQSLGASIGVFISSFVMLMAFFFYTPGFIPVTLLIMGLSSYGMAVKEKNNALEAVVWNLSLTTFLFVITVLLRGIV